MDDAADTISLTDLGVEADPGTDWHPRMDKANAYLEDGLLPDLSDREVLDHAEKPEAASQIDSAINSVPLAAEDSQASARGAV